MSMPTRKPPLWHFTHSNLICLQSYVVCKDATLQYILYFEILLPGTWSHLWFAGVRECPPWCSIGGATVTVHQFFCILHGIQLLACYSFIAWRISLLRKNFSTVQYKSLCRSENVQFFHKGGFPMGLLMYANIYIKWVHALCWGPFVLRMIYFRLSQAYFKMEQCWYRFYCSYVILLHLCGIIMPQMKWAGSILFLSCLSVCLSVVNFNLRYNLWTVRGREFIFGMHTPLIMPFQTTSRSMTLWPWLWPLH